MTLIIIALSAKVFADDSAMSIVEGGTVEPLAKHESIRMVRETVDVKLGARVGNEWPVFVHCLFEFKNDGPATDANLGFPEKARASGDAAAWGRLIGFESWVDGQPVKVEYLPSSKNPKDDFAQEYKAWYVKKVHFDTGQTRKVVVVYSARLGTTIGYRYSHSYPDGQVFSFGYILRTGANWKGNIEESIVNIDISAAGDHYTITASPKGYTSKNNKLSWIFRNFEPSEDIGVSFTRIYPLLNNNPHLYANVWEPCFDRNNVLMTSPGFITALGGSVDITDKSLVIKYGKHTLNLSGSSKAAVLDGKKITLKNAVWQGKDSNQFSVPLEETVKLLGGSVKYDSSKRPNVILKQL